MPIVASEAPTPYGSYGVPPMYGGYPTAPQNVPQLEPPSEATKANVVANCTKYMQRFWETNIATMVPSEKFHNDWNFALKVAHYEAYKELMCEIARSGETLTTYLPQFFAMTGGTDIDASVSKQQYKAYYQKSGSPMSDEDVNRFFKTFDLDENGLLTFGEYVSMAFATTYWNKISTSYCPAPADLVTAFEDDPTYKPAALSPQLKSDVLVVVQKYSERLLAQRSPVEIVNTESPGIFQRLVQPSAYDWNTRKEAEALDKGMIAAQLAFIRVLCGGSDKDQGKDVFETWMGHESNVFDKFDTDHNKMLDVSELAACLRRKVSYAPMTPCPMPSCDYSNVDFEALAKHFVELFDVNQDGGISKAEWIVARAAFLSLFIVSNQYTSSGLPMKSSSNTMLTYTSPFGAPLPPATYSMPPAELYGGGYGQYSQYGRRRKRGLLESTSGKLVVFVGVPVATIFMMGFVAGRRSRG